MRRWIIGAATAASLLGAACSPPPPTGGGGISGAATPVPPVPEGAIELVMHASESCACCGGWTEHLDSTYHVRRVDHEDMDAVKDRLGVPADGRSCHTTEVDGYVVEGHVPQEAIDDLLEQRPDIDGLVLPGMPAGSPGMGGEATEPLEVRTIVDGEAGEVFGAY
jgi:hypothetical protein